MIGNRILAPKMIGRHPQLRELEGYLRLASSGRGSVVFITGEAGVGKTRLTREFVGRARATPGIQILEGRSYEEDSAVPYGPFVDALRQLVRERGAASVVRSAGPWLGDVAKLLPELGSFATPAGPATDARSEKRRLFEAICRLIRPQASQPCCILVLEDVHWSDRTSQELLFYLARAVEHERVLVLVTYRTAEQHRHHPLTHLTAQLTRERLYHDVRLSPLSRYELSEMLAVTLGRQIPARFADALYDRTAGNPFFVEEVLRSLIEAGRIEAMIEEAWQGRRVGELKIPISVKESVLGRVAELAEHGADVLRYAAVIGRQFPFELLRAVTARDEAQLLGSLELLVEHQFVVEDTGSAEDRYSFRHALVREAVYDDLLGRERRLKHRRVLRVLEESYAGAAEDVVEQLAYHSLQAVEREKAATYARLAGDRAARTHAHREAVAHYEVALELLHTDDPREEAELYEKLGEVSYPLGETSLCLRYYREAQRLYGQAGEKLKVGDIYRLIGEISWQRGDNEVALENVRSAIELLEKEPRGRELAMAYAEYCALQGLSSRPEEGLAWGERALRLAEELGDQGVQSYATNWIGYSLTELGQPERGLEAMKHSLELAKGAGVPSHAIRAYSNLGAHLISLGEYKRAAEVLREGVGYADTAGWESGRGRLPGHLGRAEMELGNWERAEELFDRAIRAGELGYPVARLAAIPSKGELLLRQGRPREAKELLEGALPEAEELGEFNPLQRLLRALARVRLAMGDSQGALEAMDRCVRLWRESRRATTDEHLLGHGIEVYARLEREEQARELLAALSAAASRAGTPSVDARLEDALGQMAAHEGRHGDAAEYFRRAIGLWRRMGLPYQEAVSRRQRAGSLLHAGGPAGREEAGEELHRARGTFAALGACLDLHAADALAARHGVPSRSGGGETIPESAHPPERPRTPGGAERLIEPLSEREIEVLRRIAAGRSNQEIAHELYVAVSTVKTHINNIYGKLGVGSRTQALARARDLHLL